MVSTALLMVIMKMDDTPKNKEADNCFDTVAHDVLVTLILLWRPATSSLFVPESRAFILPRAKQEVGAVRRITCGLG